MFPEETSSPNVAFCHLHLSGVALAEKGYLWSPLRMRILWLCAALTLKSLKQNLRGCLSRENTQVQTARERERKGERGLSVDQCANRFEQRCSFQLNEFIQRWNSSACCARKFPTLLQAPDFAATFATAKANRVSNLWLPLHKAKDPGPDLGPATRIRKMFIEDEPLLPRQTSVPGHENQEPSALFTTT